jgi:hypothetical protein
MRDRDTNIPIDSTAIALQALTWILADEARARRLLALTGLEAEDLRARIDEPAVLDAAFDFIAAHEPDLIACAQNLGLKPAQLMAARQHLNPESFHE